MENRNVTSATLFIGAGVIDCDTSISDGTGSKNTKSSFGKKADIVGK